MFIMIITISQEESAVTLEHLQTLVLLLEIPVERPQVQLCSVCQSGLGQVLWGLLGLRGAFGLPIAPCVLA